FSSRRRHTRFSRDWSSDVCSSDLEAVVEQFLVVVSALLLARRAHDDGDEALVAALGRGGEAVARFRGVAGLDAVDGLVAPQQRRSEERRVGKECRSRWSRCRAKKT